ncbi:lysosomal Pro-X carboxypeptidase [Diachasma alloeum]|uniref:lysosomal Pro-X carboxypeptidase n=1 Tax=Diachasma alloeum TaxID=454923 RepID=UPI00073836A3|nr:lysosomal Pro-X carboxypeptidase [Diachasma alloeum]
MCTAFVKTLISLFIVCHIKSVHCCGAQNPVNVSNSIEQSDTVSDEERYIIKKFTVPVDHFNFSLNKTFEIRYLVNDTWQRGENPPIFLYTGNELYIEEAVGAAAFIYDIAPTFGALIVFAEHRYYGESLPFGNESFLNVENWGYLTSQQALADYVDLIEFLRSNSSMKHSPVITFGGSYGGMLSAWIRMKYPHVVQGAIASSAPVFQFHGVRDCEPYFQVVTSTFEAVDSECPKRIRQSWSAIDNMTATDEGRKWLSTEWKLCTPITNKTHIAQLKRWWQRRYTSLAITNDQYSTPSYTLKQINEICAHLKNTTEDSDIGVLSALGLTTKSFVYFNEDCISIADEPIVDQQWHYQVCTELVINLCTDGVRDMFYPEPFNFEEFSDECQRKFGVTPQPGLACKIYGCSDFNAASNIVFSNGLLDPWHVGGVLKNVSDSVIAVIIPEGAHQFDLAGSRPEDPKSVIEARNVHRTFISRWIQQYREIPMRTPVSSD